ncbi:MAG: redox-regulated ATPase YchF [Candidatus Sungbacteria bacterium]|nr:redox-regulated ATPase YchF [bacterium]MDZ4260159.1 redox-regulated ATPase YchF [Candidatus Sungbacteria bacterium]
MSLKIGIVGLPNVGKSTLFNALTRKKVDISNYPFCTIEPNIGVVEVPDERLDKLAEFSRSKKTVPAIVEFVDIAGLVKGAAEGEGLGNKFLTHIKETDAIAHVVRVFENPDITHVTGVPDPVSDIKVIEYELILKDLETIQKRITSLDRDIRAHKKGADEEMALAKKIEEGFKNGLRAAHISIDREHDHSYPAIKALELLTEKPIIYVFNVSEDQIRTGWRPDESLAKEIGTAPWVPICAKIESELSDMSAQEKAELLAEFNLPQSGLDKLIQTGYMTLNLMTFFTTGEDETRAWTIPIGSPAPRAGRAIHSDFEEKFIRAEVIYWQKLLEAGSWATARERGLLRTEGKTYVVKDGDVIEFKI